MLTRLLISRDDSACRIVAAPGDARRICFSSSLFILAMHTFPPRGDADSGSVSLRLPEDKASFERFEVLSDKKKKQKIVPESVSEHRQSRSESLFVGLCH